MDSDQEVEKEIKEFKEKFATNFENETAKINGVQPKTSRTQKSPEFCGNHENPEFDTVAPAREGIELRRYHPSTWATCVERAKSSKRACNYAFFKLFKYIFHGNEKGISIPMTVPVLIKEIGKDETSGEYTYQMYFYMSSPTAPSPSDPEVKIIHMETKTYFVYSFPGMVKAPDYAGKYAEAKFILQDKLGITNTTPEYFFVGYNSPFEFFNRHNEIWIEASPQQIEKFQQTT